MIYELVSVSTQKNNMHPLQLNNVLRRQDLYIMTLRVD